MTLAKVLVTFGLVSGLASAAHIHCATQPWSAGHTSTDPTNTAGKWNYTTNVLDSFLFQMTRPGAPAGTAACPYEISDIQRIDITFNFTGTMTWQTLTFGPHGNPYPAQNIAATAWTSGVTNTFIYPPHPGAGERTFNANTQDLGFLLNDDNEGFVITGVDLVASGTHYYIPEPATVALMGSGLLALLARRYSAGTKR
jgi:hypothetical protein